MTRETRENGPDHDAEACPLPICESCESFPEAPRESMLGAAYADQDHVNNLHGIADCHRVGEHRDEPSTCCPECIETAQLNQYIAIAKSEVLKDIEAGYVPGSVTSFAELHDYVDANTYGRMCDDDSTDPEAHKFFWPASSSWATDRANRLMDTIDAWLSAGEHMPTIAEPTTRELIDDGHDLKCAHVCNSVSPARPNPKP